MSEVVGKKFQMTNLTVLNNFCFTKYAQKSVAGLADVGVPLGDGDGPKTSAPGSGSKYCSYHVDQHEKQKGLDRLKAI